MPWTPFEREAAKYESWYASRWGARVDRAERAALVRLLREFPGAQSILEVGCGTGHFTRWLRDEGWRVVGLDRSPAMLSEGRGHEPGPPMVLGDAHHLPFRDGSLDLAIFVTALEFLEDPGQVLAEVVRVVRRGILLIVLNRWSVGGVSRRWGPQSHQALLGHARDFSLPRLKRVVRQGAGDRLRRLRWWSLLFPWPARELQAPVPLGDALAQAATLTPSVAAESSRPR